MGKSNEIILLLSESCVYHHMQKKNLLSFEITSINSGNIGFFNGMTLRTAYVLAFFSPILMF